MEKYRFYNRVSKSRGFPSPSTRFKIFIGSYSTRYMRKRLRVPARRVPCFLSFSRMISILSRIVRSGIESLASFSSSSSSSFVRDLPTHVSECTYGTDLYLSLSLSLFSFPQSLLVNNYQMKIPPPCVGWNLFTSAISSLAILQRYPMRLFYLLILLPPFPTSYDGTMTYNVSLYG